MIGQFILQVAEELLCHRVVIAVAGPAHADQEAMLKVATPDSRRPCTTALVAVVDQAGPGLASSDGHLERAQRQRQIVTRTHRPADDIAGVQVQHDGQIQRALGGGEEGGIRHPDGIGPRYSKALLQAVRRRWRQLVVVVLASEATHTLSLDAVFRRNRATRCRPQRSPRSRSSCQVLSAP